MWLTIWCYTRVRFLQQRNLNLLSRRLFNLRACSNVDCDVIKVRIAVRNGFRTIRMRTFSSIHTYGAILRSKRAHTRTASAVAIY